MMVKNNRSRRFGCAAGAVVGAALCLAGMQTFVSPLHSSAASAGAAASSFAQIAAPAAYADEMDGNPFEAGDFVTEGEVLYGISKEGLEKLKLNQGNLILPSKGVDGTALTKIAAFAFRPNKHEEIAGHIARPGEGGVVDDKDVDGDEIKALGQDFDPALLSSVVIPDGYVHIGQDAFAFNKGLASVRLPSTLESISDYGFGHTSVLAHIRLPNSVERIGDMAFFDAGLRGTLTLPSSLEQLGERSFKGNHIEDIDFNGAPLTELKEAVFEDNSIKSVQLGAHIAKIDPSAFSTNPGDESYAYRVVLRTPGGTNPASIPDGDNFYVDPSDDKRTTPMDIDYAHWLEGDFEADGDVVLGFSPQGELKVRKNKELEIPSTIKGVTIKKIGANAFRNVSLDDDAIKKYDLTSIAIPESIEEIGDFAFQSNELTEFSVDVDAPLRAIGAGAFMNNKIETLSLPSGLQSIGDAAFHMNGIDAVLIPKETVYLGRSAFRQNNIAMVGFETGAKLERIGEMAFAQSNVQMLDFANAHNLKEIGVQAFAANAIAGELVLPESLEAIEHEAFDKNRITRVAAPKSLRFVALNAFDENAGDPAHANKVLVKLPAGLVQHTLTDGDNFVIDPDIEAFDAKQRIDELLAKLNAVKREDLRPSMVAILDEQAAEGAALKAKAKISLGEVNKFSYVSEFFLRRVELDKAIKQAEAAIGGADNDATHEKYLKEKLAYVNAHFNNDAWNAEKIERAIKELGFLRDLTLKQGEISQAKVVQGHCELQTTLPIPSYHIGLNVYIDKNGQILYALDRSYEIGEGQTDEYGRQIENVDEDNEGYHQLAIATLPDYEGKNIADFVGKTVDSIGGIREVPEASEHRAGVFAAVQDAIASYRAEAGESLGDQGGSVADSARSEGSSYAPDVSGEQPSQQGRVHGKASVAAKRSSSEKTLPQTGDDASLIGYGAAGALFSLALLGWGSCRKRRHNADA